MSELPQPNSPIYGSITPPDTTQAFFPRRKHLLSPRPQLHCGSGSNMPSLQPTEPVESSPVFIPPRSFNLQKQSSLLSPRSPTSPFGSSPHLGSPTPVLIPVRSCNLQKQSSQLSPQSPTSTFGSSPHLGSPTSHASLPRSFLPKHMRSVPGEQYQFTQFDSSSQPSSPKTLHTSRSPLNVLMSVLPNQDEVERYEKNGGLFTNVFDLQRSPENIKYLYNQRERLRKLQLKIEALAAYAEKLHLKEEALNEVIDRRSSNANEDFPTEDTLIVLRQEITRLQLLQAARSAESYQMNVSTSNNGTNAVHSTSPQTNIELVARRKPWKNYHSAR